MRTNRLWFYAQFYFKGYHSFSSANFYLVPVVDSLNVCSFHNTIKNTNSIWLNTPLENLSHLGYKYNFGTPI